MQTARRKGKLLTDPLDISGILLFIFTTEEELTGNATGEQMRGKRDERKM